MTRTWPWLPRKQKRKPSGRGKRFCGSEGKAKERRACAGALLGRPMSRGAAFSHAGDDAAATTRQRCGNDARADEV